MVNMVHHHLGLQPILCCSLQHYLGSLPFKLAAQGAKIH